MICRLGFPSGFSPVNWMRNVAVFAEDAFHRAFVTPLIERIARECRSEINLQVLSAIGGRPRLFQQLRGVVSRLLREIHDRVDVLVIVTDANCKGENEWRRVVSTVCEGLIEQRPVTLVVLVPDPHVERWMMVDGHAFRHVFGRGCQAPGAKCERDRYKKALLNEIAEAGVDAPLGGLEYAADVVTALDYGRARDDPSLSRAVADLRAALCTRSV
jgi:hypothetical protein